MKTRLVKALCGLIAMAGAVGLTAAPASADAVSPSTVGAYCPSTYLCVYWDSHYGGDRYQFGGSNTSWGSWAIANDDSSSWNKGTSGLKSSIYTGPNYTDTRVVCLSMGGWAAHHSPGDSGDSNVWVSDC